MSKVKKLPPRNKVKTGDTWDLSSLYTSDEAWEKDFKKLDKKIAGFAKFQGTLGDSPKALATCLKFELAFDQLGEQIAVYASLKTTEDQANSTYQAMLDRFMNLSSRAAQAASFIQPELMAIPFGKMKKMLAAKELAPYRLLVEQMVRYKKHTLSKKEENLLAMQTEMAQAAGKAFRQLTDADLKFGNVKDEQGNLVELSQATLATFLYSPKRSVRKKAFHQFYEQFTGHENTLAATLSGSIQKDVYYARARGHESARGKSLFADNMPASVYDSLIESVHNRLPALYRYYELRRRRMKLKEIHQYDTYVPILTDLDSKRTWKQAVDVILKSLTPLGTDYCNALEKGLRGRWCDRYPNQGKRSGAFSSGSFSGDPYILMNYKPEVLDDVFTLTHEAGHSMHTYYSAKSQPYQYYSYTIFVAEVASTFNEQLLSKYLLENAKNDKERAYLINRDIDAIRGTIIRQTMFAEFEKITHEMAEAGEPLTLDAFKGVYRKLLELYFGPGFTLDDELSLECLRIPHFYRAFYVYKYATGLSAAIALSQRVLNGGKKELNDYLGFLKGGSSKFPLDLLRGAGVDMEKPEPVDTALAHFESLVGQLDELL